MRSLPSDGLRDHSLIATARALSPKPEPVTYNGRDIETMSRDELLAAMRETALKRAGGSLISTERDPSVWWGGA